LQPSFLSRSCARTIQLASRCSYPAQTCVLCAFTATLFPQKALTKLKELGTRLSAPLPRPAPGTLSVEFTLQGPQNTKTQNTALRRARPKHKNTKHRAPKHRAPKHRGDSPIYRIFYPAPSPKTAFPPFPLLKPNWLHAGRSTDTFKCRDVLNIRLALHLGRHVNEHWSLGAPR